MRLLRFARNDTHMATPTENTSTIKATIRPMVFSDLAQVVQLEKDIFPDPWSQQSFAESLREERVGSWVAVNDGQVIGYMVTLWVVDEVHILNLAVTNNYRRQGIASQMLANLENLAAKHGTKHFWLEVRAGNLVAQAFYGKWGFMAVGERKQYYRNGEDAVVMAKNVE
jgi:ribosomal-protein-alanine N-acetyltransferase